MQKNIISAVLLALSVMVILFSCKKEPSPTPEAKPDLTGDTILNDQTLTGKWDVFYVAIENFIGEHKIKTEWIKDTGKFVNGIGPQGRIWADEDVSTIAFSQDHRFNHYRPDGEPNSYMLADILEPSGQWNITSDYQISLTSSYGNGPKDVEWIYGYGKKVMVLFHEDSISNQISHTYVYLHKQD